MSGDPQRVSEADLAVFQALWEHSRHDVREYWVRSNSYLVVQALLLSVFVGTSDLSDSGLIDLTRVVLACGLRRAGSPAAGSQFLPLVFIAAWAALLVGGLVAL